MLCASALVSSWTFPRASPRATHAHPPAIFKPLSPASRSSSSETAVRRARCRRSRTAPAVPAHKAPPPQLIHPEVCASRFSLIGEPLFHTVYIRGAKDLAQASDIEGRLARLANALTILAILGRLESTVFSPTSHSSSHQNFQSPDHHVGTHPK